MPNFTGLWTSRQQLQAVGNGTWPGLPLFAFTTYTFNNAAATGQNGPTLGQCQTAYAGEVWLSSYFTVSPQGFQQWTVPVTGNYAIEVAGAPGGGSTSSEAPVRVTAGRGRYISQTIALTQGDVLVMVIGQTGVRGTYAGGGGGGTFVIRSGSVLISAGGGGGDGYYVATQRGQDSQDVLVGNPSTGGTGGTGRGGGGGGGFGGDGGDGQTGGVSGFGGKGYSNSFVGGAGYPTDGNGGFGGGGGAGGGTGANAGGGGGGYAGGNGCNGGSPFTASAQGGSCYVATGSPTYLGYNTGQGFITITAV